MTNFVHRTYNLRTPECTIFDMYVPRFIESRVVELLESSPVVIIEGARAVGKTRLLRALHEAGTITTIVTLTDPTHYAAASENTLAWLRSLPVPFAIDEAQLLPGLPLALKALLDERSDAVRCILTGSAAIGRTGLGGTDPLARRVSRLTLEPLSEAELSASPARPWSVIDRLFDGTPDAAGAASSAVRPWEERVILGGLPRYRVTEEATSGLVLAHRIEHDIVGLLTDNVLPGEKMDARTAHDVLSHLLMNPAGEFNATAISTALGVDRRTVNRYVNVLERRFLLHEIPNFHRPVKKSARSTSKVYPADTALSASVVLSTDRTLGEAGARGGLLEAHVVQQLVAHLGWSETLTRLTHWREITQGRTHEVDMVLQDSQGRLVAVEVKSSGSATPQHFKGIRAFKNHYGERFHRGFVVYTGDRSVAFDDNLWAIPLSSLHDERLWVPQESPSTEDLALPLPSATPESEPVSSMTDATVFISYTHKDQESATGGDIRQFALDIQDTMEGHFGRSIQLFLDVQSIHWGQQLQRSINDGLRTSTFFLPFITPRYVKSEACQDEFTQFSDAAQRSGSENLLLPLIWITPRELGSAPAQTPFFTRLRSIKYLDAHKGRVSDRSSAEYRQAVEEIARRLDEVMTERESQPVASDESPEGASGDHDEPPRGFMEYMEAAESLMPQAQKDILEFLEDFDRLGREFRTIPPRIAAAGLDRGKALARAEKALATPNQNLIESGRKASNTWENLMTSLNRALSAASKIDQSALPTDLVPQLESIADQLSDMETAELEDAATQMPHFSSHLVPTSKAVLSAVQTVRSMERSVRSWLDSLSL